MIEEARHSHPFLAQGGEQRPNATFRPIDLAEPYAQPLPPRPEDATCMSFAPGGLRRVRAFVTAETQRAGLGQQSAASLVTAVNEIATNSLKHGGGDGELRVWIDGRSLVCEVSDRGHLTSPLVGRLPRLPMPGQACGWPTSSAIWFRSIPRPRAPPCVSTRNYDAPVHPR